MFKTENGYTNDNIDVTIAPILFRDFIKLMITADKEVKIDLNVYDLSGKVIYSSSHFVNKGDHNVMIESPKNLLSGQALILELTTPTDHIIQKGFEVNGTKFTSTIFLKELITMIALHY